MPPKWTLFRKIFRDCIMLAAFQLRHVSFLDLDLALSFLPCHFSRENE